MKLTSLLKSCIHSAMTTRQQYGGWHQYLHWSELDLDQHGAGKEDEAPLQEPNLGTSKKAGQGSDSAVSEAELDEATRDGPRSRGSDRLKRAHSADEASEWDENAPDMGSQAHNRELAELEGQEETGEKSSGNPGRHRRGVRTRDSPRRHRTVGS